MFFEKNLSFSKQSIVETERVELLSERMLHCKLTAWQAFPLLITTLFCLFRVILGAIRANFNTAQ